MLYIDRTACTGCGVCVDVCPTGAISLDKKEDLSTIDLALCTACLACLDACPNGAIQRSTAPALTPVVAGEVVEGQLIQPERLPVPIARPRPGVQPSGRIMALAGMALTAAGNWLVPRVAEALIDAIERRLAGGPTSAAVLPGSRDRLALGRAGRVRGGQPRRHRRRRRGH